MNINEDKIIRGRTNISIVIILAFALQIFIAIRVIVNDIWCLCGVGMKRYMKTAVQYLGMNPVKLKTSRR